MGNSCSSADTVVSKPVKYPYKRKRGLCGCVKAKKGGSMRRRSALSSDGRTVFSGNPLSANDPLRELKVQMLPVGQKGRSTSSDKFPSPPISPRGRRKTSVDRYTYKVPLQNGHSGEVFLGADYATGQPVVVKLVKPSKTKSYETEVAVLGALNHPNIIKLVGKPRKNVRIGNTEMRTPSGKAHMLALEYAESGDLYDYLSDRGVLAEADARAFFKQIVAAVKQAHEKNIIHRDIKLENIFIAKDGTVKLGDWGLAKLNIGQFDSLKDNGGTIGYFPPEKLNKEYYDGRAADVWALGVTLFSMVSGNRPYAEPTKRDLGNVGNLRDGYLRLMMRQDWGAWWQRHQRSFGVAQFSDELKDLVQRLLDTRSAHRITVAEIEKHPWMLKTPVTAAVPMQMQR